MGEPRTNYTDDRGEILGELRPVADFLPSPDRLVPREDGVKVTLTLSRGSVEFFKQEARRSGVSYQRMIRALVDGYVRRHVR